MEFASQVIVSEKGIRVAPHFLRNLGLHKEAVLWAQWRQHETTPQILLSPINPKPLRPLFRLSIRLRNDIGTMGIAAHALAAKGINVLSSHSMVSGRYHGCWRVLCERAEKDTAPGRGTKTGYKRETAALFDSYVLAADAEDFLYYLDYRMRASRYKGSPEAASRDHAKDDSRAGEWRSLYEGRLPNWFCDRRGFLDLRWNAVQGKEAEAPDHCRGKLLWPSGSNNKEARRCKTALLKEHHQCEFLLGRAIELRERARRRTIEVSVPRHLHIMAQENSDQPPDDRDFLVKPAPELCMLVPVDRDQPKFHRNFRLVSKRKRASCLSGLLGYDPGEFFGLINLSYDESVAIRIPYEVRKPALNVLGGAARAVAAKKVNVHLLESAMVPSVSGSYETHETGLIEVAGTTTLPKSLYRNHKPCMAVHRHLDRKLRNLEKVIGDATRRTLGDDKTRRERVDGVRAVPRHLFQVFISLSFRPEWRTGFGTDIQERIREAVTNIGMYPLICERTNDAPPSGTEALHIARRIASCNGVLVIASLLDRELHVRDAKKRLRWLLAESRIARAQEKNIVHVFQTGRAPLEEWQQLFCLDDQDTVVEFTTIEILLDKQLEKALLNLWAKEHSDGAHVSR